MSSNLELDTALKVLMDAGYEIGMGHMKISGGDGAIYVPVDGVPRTLDDIFQMARAENQKPRKGPWTGQYVPLKDAPRTHQGELGDATSLMATRNIYSNLTQDWKQSPMRHAHSTFRRATWSLASPDRLGDQSDKRLHGAH
jgi:hypothetical protein